MKIIDLNVLIYAVNEDLSLIVGGTRLRFDGPGPIISDVGGVE